MTLNVNDIFVVRSGQRPVEFVVHRFCTCPHARCDNTSYEAKDPSIRSGTTAANLNPTDSGNEPSTDGTEQSGTLKSMIIPGKPPTIDQSHGIIFPDPGMSKIA
jgi:hypothetical protein